MLERQSLAMFIELAKVRHFGQTADRLNIAQSKLSNHIKRIEDSLGTQLFNRRKRSAVTLTKAGATFLGEAQLVLHNFERAERIGRLAGRGAAGPLNLGYVFSAAMCGLLSSAFGLTKRAFPELVVRSTMMETPEQLAAIEKGVLDLGFTRPRSRYPLGVEARVVHSEELVLIHSESHPLAAAAKVTAQDLGDETFIVPRFSDGPGLIDNYDRLCKVGGFTDRPTLQVKDFVTATCMAAGDYGVVLGPKSLENLNTKGLIYRSIDDFKDMVEIVMVYRSEDKPSIVDTILDSRKE